MNLSKIYLTAFIILIISTYQTNSGIILTLLMQVLLLKGALFMTMPLSIGAFMMGQGMGFFAGNMMGGYMMLRAANRYHTREKEKWSHHGGWGQYSSAYEKGKDIGSAIHAFTDHKAKLAAVIAKIKSSLTPASKGWGWSNHPSHHGYGAGNGQGGYTFHASYSVPEHHFEHPHAVHSKYKPVTPPTYKSNPYGHLKNDESTVYRYRPKGTYSHHGNGRPYYASQGYGGRVKGGSYSPSSYSELHPSSSTESLYILQDPENTYYTSAYEGPGHEYTGILTDSAYLNSYLQPQSEAQEKSSSEDGHHYVDHTPPSSETESSTVLPNPLLEKYLEKRLQEEAVKHQSQQQQEEAKQLIQLLRKAYLKQLVDSLKEEEKLMTSTEAARGSRSIEDKDNIIQQLLSYKFEGLLSSTENIISDRADRNVRDEDLIMEPSNMHGTKETTIAQSTAMGQTSTLRPSSSTSTSNTTEEQNTEHEYGKDENQNIAQEEDVYAVEATESNILSSTDQSLGDILNIPGLWIKTENTFSEENLPFSIRVRRETGSARENEKANQPTPEPSKMKPEKSQEPIDPMQQTVSSFVDDIKKFFTLLSVLDQDQCLQKLVCDVHTSQKDPATLTPYEQNILVTFRFMKALMPEGEEDSSTKYRRAAVIGETGQSLELCQQTFATCKYSSSQIISLGNQAEPSVSDWVEKSPSARSEYVTMPRVRRSLRSFYL